MGSHGHHTVVTNQPMSGVAWMVRPALIPNCPPGLEYLTTIDQITIYQKKSLLKIFTGCETRNKFTLVNNLGQIIYEAEEESDCLIRFCFGRIRPYEMEVRDNHGNRIIHIYRRLACDSCLFPCYLQKIEVSSADGAVLGTVEQEWSICIPKFTIRDISGNVILRLRGPCITSSCCCQDVVFDLLSADGETEVGHVSKQFSGVITELFTDADRFGVQFPIDLDVRVKAVVLGAVFLINSMFFERRD
ncbi:phospholipid scramblase 2-like [Ischnura elegans]|uniref:phospholipid scramblase 2-like n=1 Tax=Ischnura elegans TaxID=197161 RepID=UPI001ED867A8|nr:phospholipid scramblase 2-like [Ischnura elegans]